MTDNPYQWKAEVGKIDSDGRWPVSLCRAGAVHSPLLITSRPVAEDLAARINGTNQPTHTVRADLLDGTNLIRHWLVGRTVDSVGLAAELRQWADTFQPTDLPDGVSPWLGDEADAVAPCRTAHDLDGSQWWWSEDGNEWHDLGGLNPGGTYPALLRRKPQTVTVTVELPKDVAAEQVLAAYREALGR